MSFGMDVWAADGKKIYSPTTAELQTYTAIVGAGSGSAAFPALVGFQVFYSASPQMVFSQSNSAFLYTPPTFSITYPSGIPTISWTGGTATPFYILIFTK